MASDSELGPNSGVMRLIAAGFGELSNCHPEVLALLDRLKAAKDGADGLERIVNHHRERIAKLEALRKMALALLLVSDPSPIADPAQWGTIKAEWFKQHLDIAAAEPTAPGKP